MDNLPHDPIMLLSVINTWLRDEYPTLDELCTDRDIDKPALESALAAVGFTYIPAINQFR